MMTLCWAAKGGSGTTVVTSALALAARRPTLVLDLGGEVPTVLGCPEPDGPGVLDWLDSHVAADRLPTLELAVDDRLAILPAGRASGAPVEPDRWAALARWLADEHREVIVDAGTGSPPAALVEAATRPWLVTRSCYLAVRAAVGHEVRPSGIVLIDEPGHQLRRSDIEVLLGAPVVAHLLVDPAVARAVDAGLLVSRLPSGFRRRIAAAT